MTTLFCNSKRCLKMGWFPDLINKHRKGKEERLETLVIAIYTIIEKVMQRVHICKVHLLLEIPVLHFLSFFICLWIKFMQITSPLLHSPIKTTFTNRIERIWSYDSLCQNGIPNPWPFSSLFTLQITFAIVYNPPYSFHIALVLFSTINDQPNPNMLNLLLRKCDKFVTIDWRTRRIYRRINIAHYTIGYSTAIIQTSIINSWWYSLKAFTQTFGLIRCAN